MGNYTRRVQHRSLRYFRLLMRCLALMFRRDHRKVLAHSDLTLLRLELGAACASARKMMSDQLVMRPQGQLHLLPTSAKLVL